jgi:hypothetical protein
MRGCADGRKEASKDEEEEGMHGDRNERAVRDGRSC